MLTRVLRKLARLLGKPYVEYGAKVRGNVKLGKNVYIAHGAEIIAQPPEFVAIGDESKILQHALLCPLGGSIRIGSRVGINPFCVLYGAGGLTIGDNVLIATGCVFIPANHVFSDISTPITDQGVTTKGICIQDDVWLGAKVTVLDGVTVGRGSVIGAGAVVTRDIPPFSIALGVPARVVKRRGATPREPAISAHA